MGVEIFRDISLNNLQYNINQWLRNQSYKEIKDIKFNSTFQESPFASQTEYTAMIIYEKSLTV